MMSGHAQRCKSLEVPPKSSSIQFSFRIKRILRQVAGKFRSRAKIIRSTARPLRLYRFAMVKHVEGPHRGAWPEPTGAVIYFGHGTIHYVGIIGRDRTGVIPIKVRIVYSQRDEKTV